MKFEKILDEQLRNTINQVINTLYIECKDEYGRLDYTLFKNASRDIKEKVSDHIQNMIDTYEKL